MEFTPGNDRISQARQPSLSEELQGMITSFQIDRTIAITADNVCFDLHNNFDFIGFESSTAERKAWLRWARGEGDWVSKNLAKRFSLVFTGVSNFSVRTRDVAMPFSEDTCVASIAFAPPELTDNFTAICPEYRSRDEHLSVLFQSGAGVKVWAESVTHEVDWG